MDIRSGDVAHVLVQARDLEPEDRWQARFRVWGPGCSSSAVSMQCCLGQPVPTLSGWTLADKLDHLVVETGIKSERAALARAKELWTHWVDSEEVKKEMRTRWIDSEEPQMSPEYEGGDP